HELGHSVGMGHSTVSTAIMAPVATGITELASDDIAGITALYGTGSSAPPPSPPPSPPPPPPSGGGGSGSSSSSDDGGSGDSGHKKRCGLTGIEFPILLLGWHFLRR